MRRLLWGHEKLYCNLIRKNFSQNRKINSKFYWENYTAELGEEFELKL